MRNSRETGSQSSILFQMDISEWFETVKVEEKSGPYYDIFGKYPDLFQLIIKGPSA